MLGLEAETHEMEPVVYSLTLIQEAARGREDPGGLAEQAREPGDLRGP